MSRPRLKPVARKRPGFRKASALILAGSLLVSFGLFRGCPREPVNPSPVPPPMPRRSASASPTERRFDPLELMDQRLNLNLQAALHPSLKLHAGLVQPFLELVHQDIASVGEASAGIFRMPDGSLKLARVPNTDAENDLKLLSKMKAGDANARRELLQNASNPKLCKTDAVRSLLAYLLGRPDLHRSKHLCADAEALYRSEVLDNRSGSEFTPEVKTRLMSDVGSAPMVAAVHVHDNGTVHSDGDIQRILTRGRPEYVLSFSPKTGRVEVFYYDLEHGQTRLGTLGTAEDHARIAQKFRDALSRPPTLTLVPDPNTGKAQLQFDDDHPLRSLWHHDGTTWRRYAAGKTATFDRFDGRNPAHRLVALDRHGHFLSLQSTGDGRFEGQGNF